MYAAPSALKLLDSVYHSAIRFVTGDAFRTHHCNLYKNVGWSPLADRRAKHCILFVYKALVGKLPNYLMSLLKLKSICHNTRSQSLISLEIPLTKTNIGKIAFKFFASHKWNTVQVFFLRPLLYLQPKFWHKKNGRGTYVLGVVRTCEHSEAFG